MVMRIGFSEVIDESDGQSDNKSDVNTVSPILMFSSALETGGWWKRENGVIIMPHNNVRLSVLVLAP